MMKAKQVGVGENGKEWGMQCLLGCRPEQVLQVALNTGLGELFDLS